jgi:Cu/Ag efflux pump CusA
MQYALEREIQKIPEVKSIFAKIGTAEIATDPMPPNVADNYVMLKLRREWPNPNKEKLMSWLKSNEFQKVFMAITTSSPNPFRCVLMS